MIQGLVGLDALAQRLTMSLGFAIACVALSMAGCADVAHVGENNSPTRVEWVTDPETARIISVVLPGNGEFLVGADFPAGRYHSSGGHNCKWSKQSLQPGGRVMHSGTLGGTVEIEATDLSFRSESCSPWLRLA